MAELVLDIALFRTQCKAFSNVTTYPNVLIETNWDMATSYVSAENYGALKDSSRQYALNLMTAHLLYLADLIARGASGQVLTSASEGTVSVSLTPPPAKNQFTWWLNQSPYGQQLLALLRVKGSVGVYMASGHQPLANFRNPDGSFGAQ